MDRLEIEFRADDDGTFPMTWGQQDFWRHKIRRYGDTEHRRFNIPVVVDLAGAETAAELKRITLEVYRRGATLAAERGVIVADTKLEFGRAKNGDLVLADEVLTPDSSRFWPADEYEPGRPQHSFDKQYLRDWSTQIGWDRKPPGPEIPADVVAAMTARYAELFERLTAD